MVGSQIGKSLTFVTAQQHHRENQKDNFDEDDT